MPAYIIAEMRFLNRDWVAEYRKVVPDLIRKHGGSYIVRTGDGERLEGARVAPDLVVVMQFPDRNAALAFVNDPQYASQKAARQGGTICESLLVSGL